MAQVELRSDVEGEREQAQCSTYSVPQRAGGVEDCVNITRIDLGVKV